MEEQIKNNFKYHAPKGEQIEVYKKIRENVKQIALMINEYIPDSREKSLSLTKLEEAVMWANAGLARN